MKMFWMVIFIFGVLFGYLIGHQYVVADGQDETVKIQDEIMLPDNSVIIPIVAVSQENGTIGNATFSLVAGKGRVLLDSDPIIDTDIQNIMSIALAYAQDYTGRGLGVYDMVIDFDMPNEVVGGVSSGASITVGMIAILEGKTVNDSIVLTGTINPDGSIRRVGEIREKSIAARDAGYTLFLVPPGQSRFRFMNQTMQEYLNNTIEIREVSTISQAVEMMIG